MFYYLAHPERSVITYTTLEHSVVKVKVCSSKINEHWERKKRHVSGSPSKLEVKNARPVCNRAETGHEKM